MYKKFICTLSLLSGLASADTVLNLHADAAGTTFIDSSSYHHISTNNDVIKTSMESALGGQSMYFNGQASLDFDDSETWNLGSDDFTIDLWLKREGDLTSGVQTPLSQWHSSQGFSFIFLHHANYHAQNEVGFWLNGQVINELKGTLSEEWTHVAAIRENDVIRLYFDGVQVGSDYSVSNGWTVNNSGAKLKVGNQQDGDEGHGWNGYIDEVRISTAALDPATFPPEHSSCDEDADYNQDGKVDIEDLLLRRAELTQWIEACWEPSVNGGNCE